MAQMSRRFNFDEFDKLCGQALDEDAVMAEEDRAWEEEQAWADHDRVFNPGEIGGVLVRPSFTVEEPEPPEAA